jgi:membrane associated rhomboid family serine protease
MLDDRYYMRRTPFQVRQSVTVMLLLVNVAAFVLQLIVSGSWRFSTNEFLDKYFALSLYGLSHGYVWQLVTFQFMHGGPIHLLLNCWAIFIFGREVEEALGRKTFLTLYLSSGVLGGLVQMLGALLVGGHFAGPVVGASAGAFGLIAAFATLFPERPLTMLLFFIIPVNMRAKFLLWLSAVIAVAGIGYSLSKGADLKYNIADAAHLGGMLGGILFVRYAIHWHWPGLRRTSSRQPRRMVKVGARDGGLWGRTKPPVEEEDLPPEEFLRKEVDPILDKISAHGIQSLTERERRVLEAARTKMAKR